MKIKKVMIAGAGTLGSQIAWQTASHGFEVTVYDAFEKGLEQGKEFHKQFAALFMNERGVSKDEIEATFARLKYTTNLDEAAGEADLVSESVPEALEIKQKFYTELAKAAPEKTIFTTNTSSLLPSKFAEFTGRPEKFLALHFANGIWDANIGEVMPHAGTKPEYVDIVVQFAKDIGMVPVVIKKEQPAYILNTLLIPLLGAGLELLAKGVADAEDIDKTWMIGAQVKMGPCAIMDMIGLETVYHVLEGQYQETKNAGLKALADYLKVNFIDKGWLGVKTGKGFYTYPEPAFQKPDFLK